MLNLRFGFHEPSVEHVIDLIHKWIGRAGVLPLQLTINFGFCWTSKEYESRVERLRRIYNALSKYASRWESLVISMPGNRSPSFPQLDHVPLLRYLSIGNLFHGCRAPFLSAPRLTTLVISGLQCKTSKIPTIPWRQLTVLHISKATSFSVALDLIKRCPRLEELAISISHDMVTGPHRPRIEHATLREVSFPHACTIGSRAFLDSLSLPALKRLSLIGTYFELTELFNQSNCELEALYLTNFQFNPDEFQECIGHESCKTLTCLYVTNDARREMVNDELLIRLTCYEGEAAEPLCPNLERLTFRSCCTNGTFPGLLGEMVLSRCLGRAGVKQLQTFSFTAISPLPAEDVELLECASLNGLQFHVMTTHNWRKKEVIYV